MGVESKLEGDNKGIEDEEIEFMEDLLAMVLLYGGGGLAIGGYGAIEAKRLFG